MKKERSDVHYRKLEEAVGTFWPSNEGAEADGRKGKEEISINPQLRSRGEKKGGRRRGRGHSIVRGIARGGGKGEKL